MPCTKGANADDYARARKPCTGNLYARFEEGGGGNSAPTLPLTAVFWIRGVDAAWDQTRGPGRPAGYVWEGGE